MFYELIDKKNNFRKKYFANLLPRFCYASLSLEGVDSCKSAMTLQSQSYALDYAFKMKEYSNITNSDIHKIEDEIITIDKIITEGAFNGFRQGPAYINGEELPHAWTIHPALSELLIRYYNYMKDLDPLEREAYFHIDFLCIHPFGDGNGRTARTILFKNLCKQGIVPCVITKDVKDEYCRYIHDKNYKGLTELFKRLSDIEYYNMIGIYNSLDAKGCIKENKMTKIQERAYRAIIQSETGEDSISIDDVLTDKEYVKKYIFRDVNNLLSIFKNGSLPKNVAGRVIKRYIPNVTPRYEQFLDIKSGDVIIYCEDNKTLELKLKDDERYFTISQTVSNLVFYVGVNPVLMDEFDYELKKEFEEKKKEKILIKKKEN